VGDAAHVMPPVGIGVNLAMLDAAELAEALVAGADWMQAVKGYEETMLARAEHLLPAAREGFEAMFGSDAPFAVLEHMGMTAEPGAPA
jgi:2-polyprenyl-6-methoxyphenol hydroxylase-like FAD-dependent oxidoreductase